MHISRLQLDELERTIPANRRSILKELRTPGSVRGRVGERIRAALRALGFVVSQPRPDLGESSIDVSMRGRT